jgi:hypothetical protein
MLTVRVLATAVDDMVYAGRVTRSHSQDTDVWLTYDVIARMNAAVLRTSVVDGTWSWELTIEKCLALSLMVALCCRAGEVTRTPGLQEHGDAAV